MSQTIKSLDVYLKLNALESMGRQQGWYTGLKHRIDTVTKNELSIGDKQELIEALQDITPEEKSSLNQGSEAFIDDRKQKLYALNQKFLNRIVGPENKAILAKNRSYFTAVMKGLLKLAVGVLALATFPIGVPLVLYLNRRGAVSRLFGTASEKTWQDVEELAENMLRPTEKKKR